MKNQHQATKDFEAALCEYTGAPYAVAVNSCTMALLLAVEFHLIFSSVYGNNFAQDDSDYFWRQKIEIPKRTYVSVPQSIIHAGGQPVFRDEDWLGFYQLSPLPVFDFARMFTSGMYMQNSFQCVSFHASKILGDTQGGAILHDNREADAWLRRARFDGRTEGLSPKYDTFNQIGWHCYMSPDVATRLLWKLSFLPKQNNPIPNDDYPDLSQMEIFK